MRSLTIKQPNPQCPSCPLGQSGRCYIGTDVSTDTVDEPTVDIMFVIDFPSHDDNIQRTQLASETGRIVREYVKRQAGSLRYAFAHLVRCRPREDGEFRAPTQQEVDLCSMHVEADIKQLRPKVVVLMGALAVMTLNPDPSDTTWASGAVMDARRRGAKLVKGVSYVAMVNPSILASRPNQQGMVLGDIDRAIALARGTEDPFSKEGTSVLVGSVKEFLDLKNHIVHGLGPDDCVAMDTETANLCRIAPNPILTWQFAWDPNTGYVVPYQHEASPWSRHEIDTIIRPGLIEIFTSKEAKFDAWVMHNAPFDIDKVQRECGIYRLNRPTWCTQFGAYTYDENRVNFDFGAKAKSGFGPLSLKTLAPEWLNFFHYKDEADVLEARHAGLLSMLSMDKLVRYAGMDAYVTFRLRERILDMAGRYAPDLNRFVLKWFGRANYVSPCIERNGIYVDRHQLDILGSDQSPILARKEEILTELNELPEVKATNQTLLRIDGRTAGMQALFGEQPWLFSMSKKDHLIELFVNQLDLEPLKYGKPDKNFPDGVPSIDRHFFKEHEIHPSIKLIEESRGLDKLKDHYVTGISDFLQNDPDMQDGRVRAQLLWTRTVTNRLSQKNPNNSQLPRGDNKYKKAIKALYRAAPGHVLIEIDYSQAEIRWWAELASDTAYQRTFMAMQELRRELAERPRDIALAKRVELECDVHRQSAALMFRKPIQDVTKKDRQAVKSLVFGAIYGQHVKTLATLLKISVREAEELQSRFFSTVPHAFQWLRDIEHFALRHGYVVDAFKRRRHLKTELQSHDKGIAARALRQARNSPVQASSSNMMIMAACQIHDRSVDENLPLKMENLVHDAILVETPLDLDKIQTVVGVMEHEMTTPEHLRRDWKIPMMIPFEVDYKIGLSWGFAEGVGPTNPIEEVYERLVAAAKAENEQIAA